MNKPLRQDLQPPHHLVTAHSPQVHVTAEIPATFHPYPRAMRETFRAELDTLIDDLARAARLAGQMMTNASTALNQADLGLAELVISGECKVKALCDDMDQRCVKLLLLQAPVATDLRVVVAAMHAVGDVGRMCNLAQHIAKIARMKHPTVPIPGEVRPVFARMGLLATNLAQDASEVWALVPRWGGWGVLVKNSPFASCRHIAQVFARA